MAPVVTLHAVCSCALALSLLSSTACSRGSEPAAFAASGASDMSAQIEELRFRIAGTPSDRTARAELARLEQRAGRPGAALRHYLVLADRGLLPGADRGPLAALLVERAAARTRLGDGDAMDDLVRARRLDGTVAVAAEDETAALAVAALAALRANQPERARAFLDRLPADDGRRAVTDPEAATMERLAAAASWTWDAGARRAGLALLEVYWRRGGDDAAVLERFAAARTWWKGSEGLDYLARKRLVAAGVTLCAVALRLDEYGCQGQLAASAAQPERARALGERARVLNWRDADPAWASIALAGWLAGDVPGWGTEVVQRWAFDGVDDPLAALLAGKPARARAALKAALARARDLTAAEREVLLAEAALLGETGAVDAVLEIEPTTAAWVIALRGADAGGDAERLRSLLQRAPAAARRTFLSDRGWFGAGGDAAERRRAARWRLIADDLGYGEAAVRLATRLGLEPSEAAGPPLGRVFTPRDPALAAIARGYERDPAVGDRLAADYADGAVALGERGPAIATLFARLGDPGRALEWWSAIARSSPNHPAYQLALVEASAAAGDPTRALVHATSAAARSGDPGAVFLATTRILLRHDAPAEAMQSARSASGLVPAAERSEVLDLVVVAAERLGRADEVAAARRDRALIREAPPAPLAGAPNIALEGAWAPARPEALRAAAAWNPHDVAVRGRWLAAVSPDEPAFADAVVELVGLGLDARFPQRQRAALELLAEALERAGKVDAARRARLEARTVRQGAPPS